ncbi:cytochrome ubiquinol oxidase subunit I [Natronomonas sp. CBA1123]|jgi:cytochrome d ubiquinol oxidase subunit I|uniref:cytochrome ubiquinol oxidase subunit I n=1 Tax=Natronomonas sp. CBA1123 TaxID=2668070 RepID=UPI0012E9DD68|nr:cytochrome ubiquinol oxidase subunit I [Natronomonas sp. CBA1123]MUV88076.1 cytochrome ubiquinol oxidase subunit I [Natronomonas sp. CBA1123]
MIDPVIASRLQFALTTIVHIIFPVMSMGLAPFLIYFTWKEIRTEEQVYEQLRAFWTKIFAISFVVGTVTGIVLEFEFGTNFAAFSTAAGELFGGPLAMEGMMAFMLEATFLGIFVFGRERVTDRLYMISSVFVGLGTWLSAVWILIANSWMQTPRGYEVAMQSGQPIILLVDPIAAYANPRFPWMYVHMQNAAVLSVALFMTGVAAYYVWTNRDTEFWRKTMKIGLAVLLVTAPFQAIHGDAYGRHVADTQPQKFAAMEAQYETDSSVGLKLLAFPTSVEDITDPHAEELFVVEIPFVASLLASGDDPGATITGLDEFDSENPPVAIVFWAFRAMVGLGFWFILLAFWGGYRWLRGELFEDDLLAKALVGSSVLGILTVELGWIVTEVGRQPWVIQGVMKTHAGVSPGLTGTEALITLAGFVGVYAGLLTLYWYVVVRLIREQAPTRPATPNRDVSGPEKGVPGDD